MHKMKLAILLGLPLTISCGDKAIDDLTADDNSGTAPPAPSLKEAAAVGFDIIAGWDQATNQLTGYKVDETTTYEKPRVVLTIATAEFFQTGAATESCVLVAEFNVDPDAEDFPVNLYGWGATANDADSPSGASGTPVAPFTNGIFSGYLEVLGESAAESYCSDFDPTVFPDNDMLNTFNLMHFGVAFTELSQHNEDAVKVWYADEDNSGDLNAEEQAEWEAEKPEFFGQHIAINHPATGGYDFIGYDWNWGRSFEIDIDTLDIPTEPCEDDPDTTDDESEEECLIATAIDQTASDKSYYLRSNAYWHEDFPFMDLTILQEGNGL